MATILHFFLSRHNHGTWCLLEGVLIICGYDEFNSSCESQTEDNQP